MTKPSAAIFHHAFPVTDVEATRRFYGGLLNCPMGPSMPDRADFNFFGHHLVAHRVSGDREAIHLAASGPQNARSRHFGVALEWDEWEALPDTLERAGSEFLVPPLVRRSGEPAEEALMMLQDPSGNVIEFKTFRDMKLLFKGG